MSQPLPPPVPDWAASTPDWPGSSPWQAPSAWAPPGAPHPTAPFAPAVPAPSRSKGPLVLGVVALAGVVGGAVGAAFLVTAVFVGAAEEIGESMGRGMVAETEQMYSSMEEEDFGWYAGPPVDAEDLSDPVAPAPGPDPVLDAYAQSCFEGDYQSCDDLFWESPPLSDYEQYGGTCGGRVKLNTVMACTELE